MTSNTALGQPALQSLRTETAAGAVPAIPGYCKAGTSAAVLLLLMCPSGDTPFCPKCPHRLQQAGIVRITCRIASYSWQRRGWLWGRSTCWRCLVSLQKQQPSFTVTRLVLCFLAQVPPYAPELTQGGQLFWSLHAASQPLSHHRQMPHRLLLTCTPKRPTHALHGSMAHH